MIPENEPAIKREDSTPTLAEQADKKGWGFGIYSFGLGESDDVTYFNPGLVEREDGLWLIARRAENAGRIFGVSNVWAFMLDETGKIPKKGVLLQWPDTLGGQQYEDARAFYHPRMKQTCVGATTFIWRDDGSWTGAHQVVGFFDEEWQCKIKHDPVFGGNADHLGQIEPKNYEKSWMWFLNTAGKLVLFYKPHPWILVEFGDTWEEREIYHEKGLTWKWGEIRNGTPPVLVDGKFISFFHSSLPWQGNYRRYYMGVMSFSLEPPYHPIEMSAEPMLAGSQNDEWQPRKPPCIFPCGAVLRGNTWLISAGLNDLRSAWIEMPHESVVENLLPIGKSVTPIFPANGLSEQEARRAKLRDNMAKARAVRAANVARRKAGKETAIVAAE